MPFPSKCQPNKHVHVTYRKYEIIALSGTYAMIRIFELATCKVPRQIPAGCLLVSPRERLAIYIGSVAVTEYIPRAVVRMAASGLVPDA
jgi:hypothetical protein